jgi:hypothetical protein
MVPSILVVAILDVVALWSGSEVLAGLVFLLTCVLLGLAALGACVGPVVSRASWLGAAVFGWGYLLLAFNAVASQFGFPYLFQNSPPRLITAQTLDQLRVMSPALISALPPPSNENRARNWHIVQALARPISVRFREAPLSVAIQTIKKETRGPDFPDGIPIYVDPVGLQESEKTMDSPVELEVTGVPIRTSLGLMLDQLGMKYMIKDGLLLITNSFTLEDMAKNFDPFDRIGHCLIALLAALLGTGAARLLSQPSRD